MREALPVISSTSKARGWGEPAVRAGRSARAVPSAENEEDARHTAPSRRRRRDWRAAAADAVMVVPALAIYVVLMVVPVLFAVYYSFTDYNGFPAQQPAYVGWDNYVKVFGSTDMQHAMIVTVIVAAVGSVAVNLVALGLAVLLQKSSRFNTFGRVVMFYPHVLSMLIVGFLWSAIVGPQGIVNTIRASFGQSNLPFLSDPSWALWTMIFVIVWAQFGVQLVLYLAGLQTVPAELLEAARIDGATRWQAFRNVTWPALAPTVTVALITSCISLLKTYDVVVSLTEGGPAGATRTVVYNILAVSFPQRSIGMASAQAVLLIIAAAALAFAVIALRRRAEEGAEALG